MGTKAGRRQWVPHKGWENQGLHHLLSTMPWQNRGLPLSAFHLQELNLVVSPCPSMGSSSASLFLSISVPAPGLGTQKYLAYL